MEQEEHLSGGHAENRPPASSSERSRKDEKSRPRVVGKRRSENLSSPKTPGDRPCTSDTPKRRSGALSKNNPPQFRLFSSPSKKDAKGPAEYKITGMNFQYMRVTFDIEVPGSSGDEYTKSTISLEDVQGGFESSQVRQFKENNPEVFEMIFKKYTTYQKDEAEAEEKGIVLKACPAVPFNQFTGGTFSLRNDSETHDIYYNIVVASEGVKLMDRECGRVPKRTEFWIPMRTLNHYKKKPEDCLWVEWHWGEQGDAPRLTRKIEMNYM